MSLKVEVWSDVVCPWCYIGKRRFEAARAYGISGVPFFVIDGRYGISGAQPADNVLQTLDKAWSERPPLALVTPEGSAPSCEGDSCAV